MDSYQKQEFIARIRSAKTADVAKDIDVDLYMARHDYFGRQVCESLNIPYRNDVALIDILIDCIDDFNPLAYNIPNITPDNYIKYDNNTIFILDYKVTLSMETVNITLDKYNKAIREITPDLNTDIFVVIIQINPRTKELYISNDLFRNIYGLPNIDIDFDDFFELKKILYDKFEDDDEFLMKIAHGDFTLTAPWLNEDTPELFEHEIFNEFIESLDIDEQKLFYHSIDFSAYGGERWNANLHRIKEFTQQDYDRFIKTNSDRIFTAKGCYNKPSRSEINEGWKLMTQRIKDQRDIQDSHVMQKPSVHFIWTPPDVKETNNTTAKLIKLSKLLQNITGSHPMLQPIRELGKCFDFSEDITGYEDHVEKLKQEARKAYGQVKNNQLKPKLIGRAVVQWEQQFILSSENIELTNKRRLLKDFAGIGSHKQFKCKTQDDIDLAKPKILDFNSETIYLESLSMMNKTKVLLSQKSEAKRREFILEEYGNQIASSSPETIKDLKDIVSSNYWFMINDYSALIKNMLAMSQYNKANTFRIAVCANNNIFGVLLPASDIKTKKSTIVYFIIAIHKEEKSIFNPGALCYTFKSGSSYVSISKAMRLDKQRCQRIVASPGLFLTSTLLLKGNNSMLNLIEIMNFTIFTSLSITKAMLSLTEPSRYMIMNSLAICSDVKGYIAEKFSPYTKTLFSVYMTRLIRNACYQAYDQRDKVTIRDIHLTDYEITQKGVNDNRNIVSIWFPGLVTIKEYINQIYLPFYFNSKGLHEEHHVMVDLIKTVGEIELEQRECIKKIWSTDLEKQTVNLRVFLHSLAKNLISDTSRHNHLRNKIESRNNFRRSPTTISTFTSSKSCIKIGDFQEFKAANMKKQDKEREKFQRKCKIANPLFFDEEAINSEISHTNYLMMKEAIPNVKDYITTKNFDRLYELYKADLTDSMKMIDISMKYMKEHKEQYFAIFNKGQKTAKDREIFEPEWETKTGMYLIERISKERCKLNPDEMISEPGDGKLKILEQKSEQEIRFMVNALKSNREEEINDVPPKATKIEVNADMSKWSAQDVFYKYFWLIAMDPILYPKEKFRIIYFMCNYMNKNLIIPDSVMCNLLDQKVLRPNDIFMVLTDNFSKNYFNVKRNWLQGNFNYTSSYVHSCAMSVFKEIVKSATKRLQGEVLVNSLVHSDDNHTSITIIQNKVSDDTLIEFINETFKNVCLSFGCQVNAKKTYMTNFVKEFVSLFNIFGEPFSIYGRFLLTSVGDCAYIGPYEDLSSRISAVQTAIKHGCPPSLAWVGIALAHWMTYTTYNMMPGQKNDPLPFFPTEDRGELPIELFGFLKAELSTIALVGMESKNLEFLIKLLQKQSPVMQKKEPVLAQMRSIPSWDMSKLTEQELIQLKILRFLVLDTDAESNSSMGETSDMRSRSLITPRKFTTSGSLKKLVSYQDYQNTMSSKDSMENLLDYIIQRPELMVTKGETKTEYENMTIFRYNSKKFKESLSIQNPSQLFIEQILFSNKPVIDYRGIKEKFISLAETRAAENFGEIVGRCTFQESYRMLINDLRELILTLDDILVVYNYCIANDPLILTVANSIVLSTVGSPMSRLGNSSNNMPEFRSLKLIHHSPAVVLRCYSQNRKDLPGVNEDEIERDLVHLNDFIETTKLKEKMNTRIEALQDKDSQESKMFIIREYTKFYQICYEYIKSAEHKVKIFILPIKTRNIHDFCSTIQGSLLRDNEWYTMHYLKQVVVQGHKAIITKTEATEMVIANECFRLLPFFLDSFVCGPFRIRTFNSIMETFSYKGLKVKDLWCMLLNSNSRHNYLPLLWQMGELNQKDIDRFDSLKSSERITWNNNQVSREFDTGPIDLTITGYNREIKIVGNDDTLYIAELTLSNKRLDSILNSGRKLLNCKHGLRFERMKKVDIEEGELYITYQKKTHYQFMYQIHTYNSIVTRNAENFSHRSRSFNEIIPVCRLIVSEYKHQGKITMSRISVMNSDNESMSKLQVTPNETFQIKRASLDKMKLFDGPEVIEGLISINKLMSTSELMTLDFTKISNSNMITLSSIFNCEGNHQEDDDMVFVISDEPVDQKIPEALNTTPLFNVHIPRSGFPGMSYKNALREAINREVTRFKLAFDFSSRGFTSRENLGILQTLISVIKLLHTNEWSTIMSDSIHLALLIEKFDRIYHLAEIPNYFIIDPICNTINWLRLKSFIKQLPPIIDPFWHDIFEHFRTKCIQLIDQNTSSPEELDDIINAIALNEGRGDFEFN
ncbi:L [Bangui virus]|nr:L [Bangui virus] [Bangui virus]